MNKKIFLLLVLSLVACTSGYYLLKVYDCETSLFCFDLMTKSFALFYGMGALAFVFLILLFVPRAVYAWKKFAVWFVPIVAVLFAIYPQPGAGDFVSPDPITVFKWVSGFYILVSLTIIMTSFFRSRK